MVIPSINLVRFAHKPTSPSATTGQVGIMEKWNFGHVVRFSQGERRNHSANNGFEGILCIIFFEIHSFRLRISVFIVIVNSNLS